MWRDANWKLENLVNSTLNYMNNINPSESRYLRANQVIYLNKEIRKAIDNFGVTKALL